MGRKKSKKLKSTKGTKFRSQTDKNMRLAVEAGEQQEIQDEIDRQISKAQGKVSACLACGKDKRCRKDLGCPKFTSEPIPDYIMRAIQPKKSVHPEYGNLRY